MKSVLLTTAVLMFYTHAALATETKYEKLRCDLAVDDSTQELNYNFMVQTDAFENFTAVKFEEKIRGITFKAIIQKDGFNESDGLINVSLRIIRDAATRSSSTSTGHYKGLYSSVMAVEGGEIARMSCAFL